MIEAATSSGRSHQAHAVRTLTSNLHLPLWQANTGKPLSTRTAEVPVSFNLPILQEGFSMLKSLSKLNRIRHNIHNPVEYSLKPYGQILNELNEEDD